MKIADFGKIDFFDKSRENFWVSSNLFINVYDQCIFWDKNVFEYNTPGMVGVF